MALKQEISVVWFKRDLRLRDNPCVESAIKSGLPLLLLYIVEPEQEADPHFDIRHWRFIYQSIVDLNEQLDESKHSIHIVKGSAIEVLQAIQSSHVVKHLFSHDTKSRMGT
jgi:deoxyribodipyrimidine photo-lyase